MLFRHHIVEFFARRTASTSLRLLTASTPSCTVTSALAQLGPARVTPVGNRWRPPYGGPHERRIHGTPTCYRPPPRWPPRPADLPGAGPHRGLVPQVVAPLPRRRRRGPVRPRPRVVRLGRLGADPVAGDPAVSALQRQPGVHPGRGAAVQRQRGELQRLVPGAAVPAALQAAG